MDGWMDHGSVHRWIRQYYLSSTVVSAACRESDPFFETTVKTFPNQHTHTQHQHTHTHTNQIQLTTITLILPSLSFSTMKFASSFLFLTAATTVSAFAPVTNSNSIRSSASTSLDLAVGETAPDFQLVDQNGKTVTRSTTFKNKPLVVYFYPADSTPGCTIQAETFDSKIKDIRKKYGADVVGISGQDVESKQKFASELGLSFSILADTNDQVRKEFGVPRAAFGLFPGRVTYVLDKDGVCQSVYDELADAASHVDKAEEVLQTMKPASAGGILAGLFN
mmetsp:Transcript_17317/g.42073  ORF Transcript_17317/g.42073 Transcript_17317/m.42073 type:complete len:279 (+) Transcript_17317:2287-3123(+)